MTLPRYQAICEHWERVPPLSVSASVIAQSLGATRPKKKAEAEQANNRQSLLDMLGGAGFSREKPEWQRQTT